MPHMTRHATEPACLAPGSRVRIGQIKDGTSNTIMVGEQSDWGRDPGVCPGRGPNEQLDIRMARRAGIWTGASTGRVPLEGQGGGVSHSVASRSLCKPAGFF